MSYVLGIDPGGTTGLARLWLPDDAPADVVSMQEVAGGVEGFIEWLESRGWGLNSRTVCESFVLDGRTPKPDLNAVEIIGILKYVVASGKLVFQTNTQGKHLMTNEVLKRAGYYPKRGEVKGGHSTDALRHALNYVVKTLKHKPTIEKLFPKEES